MAQASAEKLEHVGPAEKERVATERAVGKYARAPDCMVGESQGEREPHLGEREWEHGEERVDSTVKEGRFQE